MDRLSAARGILIGLGFAIPFWVGVFFLAKLIYG